MTDPIKSAIGRTAECPPLEVLAGAQRNQEAQRHLAGCSYCRAELALFQVFEAGKPQASELAAVQSIVGRLRQSENVRTESRPESSVWDRVRGWLWPSIGPARQRGLAMMAASLLIAAAAGVYWEQRSTPVPSTASSPLVWRSGGFAATFPSGDMTRTPAEFRWEKFENAAAYQVELLQVDRTVIWTGRSEQSTVEIPNDIRDRLRPGRAFQWRVIAKSASGEVIGSTNLQTFHIISTTP